MPNLIRIGRLLSGIGMIGVGGLALAYSDFVMEWTNVPDHLPARAAFAYVHGAILLLAGMGLLFDRTVRVSALILELVWLVWTLLRVPITIANWRTLGGLAEVFAITSGFLLLAGLSGPRTETKRREALAARYCFALCMPAFGVVHFLYPAAVASWVPGWLPGHMFWAYFTGVAHCAAGLAILTGVLASLASRLFAIMLSSWVLIVHIPRVMATPRDRHEWTTFFVALLLTGLAWILAQYVSRSPWSKPDSA
jgi:uncharacterized membrane protein